MLLLQTSKGHVAEQQDDTATKLFNRRVAVRQSLFVRKLLIVQETFISFCIYIAMVSFLGTLNNLV